MDEFTVMMNQYVPTSTLGLRDLFNTFGRKERVTNILEFTGFVVNQNPRFEW